MLLHHHNSIRDADRCVLCSRAAPWGCRVWVGSGAAGRGDIQYLGLPLALQDHGGIGNVLKNKKGAKAHGVRAIKPKLRDTKTRLQW